jgi:NitT/TauT family transport system substrate-binding protein
MPMTRRSQALRLFSAAAGALALPTRVAAQALTPLRVGTVAADPYAQAYFLADQGGYARAKITAEVQTFVNGAACAQAAAGGAIDVGISEPVPIANAINHGVPFAFFAGAGLYSSEESATYLCVDKSSSISTARELEGQTVAVVSLVSISAIAVKDWLVTNGADLGKVRLIELPFPQMAPALARGTVAAAFIGEPFLTDASTQVRQIGKAYDTLGKQFYIACWFSTRDWIEKNFDVAKRLATAIADDARWANAHKDASAAILARATKIELDRVRSMRRAVYAVGIEPKLLQPVLDIALKYKAIDRPVAATDLITRI